MFTCRKSLAAELAPAAIAFRSMMIIAYVPHDPMLRSGTVTRIYSLHGRPDSYILTKLRYDRISPSRPTSNANVNYGARVPREKRERTSFLALRYLRGKHDLPESSDRYVQAWTPMINGRKRARSDASGHEIVKSILHLSYHFRMFQTFVSLRRSFDQIKSDF